MGTLGMEVKYEASYLPPDFNYKESKMFIEDPPKTTRDNGLN